MKKTFINFIVILWILFSSAVKAQNNRLYDNNTIGWFNYFGTFKLNNKYSLHSEAQLRRVNLIYKPQQILLRTGINYQPTSKWQLRLGYAFIETYAYGNIPINSQGKKFTEHRIFQTVTLTDKINKVELTHRFMLEQRFIGRYSSSLLIKEDEYPLLHRARYLFRLQIPLINLTSGQQVYAAAYNEILVGFGKNVNENIFDQNRIGILLGCKLNNSLKVETGYINQTLQLGREVTNKNVFQSNNGIIVNLNINLDLSSKDLSN